MRLCLLMGLVLVSGNAYSAGGRSLPSGENDPAVVEAAYDSPRGEVHFVAVSGGHSALLRTNRGSVAALSRVDGPSGCDEWLIDGHKEGKLPPGCDFVFYDGTNGQYYSIRSEEMESGTLFQAVKGTMRGVVVAL